MPVFVFSILMTLISLGATILIVMLIFRTVEAGRRARREAFYKALDRGIYDVRLLGGKTGPRRAALGWGIFFVATGLGIFFGLAANVDPMVLRMGMPGTLIPLFIGIGLIVFHYLSRSASKSEEQNGQPVRIPPVGSVEKPVERAQDGADLR